MVRLMEAADVPWVQRMMGALWPESEAAYDFANEVVYVWDEDGTIGGFASVSVRSWVEGSSSEPCPHVEGWYVEPALRQRGVGRALMDAIAAWARQRGFRELTSDAELQNEGSLAAHKAIGFEPTVRLQYFRKLLPD